MHNIGLEECEKRKSKEKIKSTDSPVVVTLSNKSVEIQICLNINPRAQEGETSE